MSRDSECGGPAAKPTSLFATTHWSVVRRARNLDAPEAASALERLCRTYWYPIYAHVRRRGYNPEDARDLTQEFFAQLLRAHIIDAADPNRGRFRSFLLGVLKHFLADARDHARAQKRGGGEPAISWELDVAEARLAGEPASDSSPDQLYDRRWAMTVLTDAANRLRNEYAATGRLALYDALKCYVADERDASSYGETAAALHTTESSVKSAIFRLRQRHHALIREEVAQTIEDPVEMEDELRHLAAIFS